MQKEGNRNPIENNQTERGKVGFQGLPLHILGTYRNEGNSNTHLDLLEFPVVCFNWQEFVGFLCLISQL